jgi:hypothetical protein
MASIRSYRTSKGERRYEVRFRDAQGRERSKAFSARKDAQSFKLDIERKRQAGVLYQAAPEPFGKVAAEWLERYERGAAGHIRPRPRSIALAHENLAALAPLSELSVERIRQPLVEDLIVAIAERGPRRAEMALGLLKRILRAAEERGQVVDPAFTASGSPSTRNESRASSSGRRSRSCAPGFPSTCAALCRSLS